MGKGLLVKPETALAILSLDELFTEISHDTCTTISLRSGRLAVVSLSKLVWPLLLESPKLATFVSQMFWVTTSFLPAVGCSLTLYSCCSLERVCPSGLWSPSSPLYLFLRHISMRHTSYDITSSHNPSILLLASYRSLCDNKISILSTVK